MVQVKGEQVWKRHTEQLREVGDTPVEDSDDLAPVVETESFPVTSDAVKAMIQCNLLKYLLHCLLVRTLHHLLHQILTTRYPCKSHQPPERYHT